MEVREVALKTDSPADAFGLQLMQERFSFPAFTMSDPNKPDPIVNYATEVQATIPLFTGGKLEAGIAQAGRMEKAAAAVRDHTESAVFLGVADAYAGVLLADRFLELAEKARDTTTKHVEQAQAFYDAGMLVESDLLQARTQRSRMEEKRDHRPEQRATRAGGAEPGDGGRSGARIRAGDEPDRTANPFRHV